MSNLRLRIGVSNFEAPEARTLAIPGLRMLRDQATSDGTPKRNFERALDNSEARFRHVVEFAPNAMVMTNAQGRIELVNVQAERLFGYPRTELLGEPVEMLVPERFRVHHPSFRSAFLKETKLRPMGAGHDLYGVRKDGSEFPVEIDLNAIETAEGAMVLSSIVDISERKRNDRALRESVERFRSIFQAVSQGLLISDLATGAFIEVNEAGYAMFGYGSDELIGSDFQRLSSGATPYTNREAEEWIERAGASGNPQLFDWHCKAKDGRLFWAEISLRIDSISGRDVVLSTIRDVTEQRAVEAQLRQAQKMEAIGQLTGGMAHDFNNLLSVVIGNLDILRSARPNDPEVTELAGEALNAALGGADLTRRLLAFARRQPLQPQRVDLKGLLSGTVKLLSRVLSENIEISLDFANESCRVLADPAQLEAVLTNLATNARDAMPRGGKLLIATGRRHLDATYTAGFPDVEPGEYAVIEVTDSGVGMPPEIISHIFEPFYTTKGRDQGTGLGLSMVFGFLKQSGGHVGVYSEVGVGTTFRLYLPCVEAAEDTKSAPGRPDILASKGESVLVVEDSTPLRRLVVRQLGELGYRVLEAKSGIEAIRELGATKVDLLFTDVVMPGDFDGFELAHFAVKRWPRIRVILTSGFPETKLKEDFLSADFRLLVKPYRKDDLARIVREVLDMSTGRANLVGGRHGENMGH